jgi:hypothetical protein
MVSDESLHGFIVMGDLSVGLGSELGNLIDKSDIAKPTKEHSRNEFFHCVFPTENVE